jgi:hypothetical protein
VWLFLRAATRVPDPKGAPWLDRQLDRVTGPLRRMAGFGPRRDATA